MNIFQTIKRWLCHHEWECIRTSPLELGCIKCGAKADRRGIQY